MTTPAKENKAESAFELASELVPFGRLWRRWVFANIAGEVVGLGTAAAVGIWFAINYESNQPASIILLTAALVDFGRNI